MKLYGVFVGIDLYQDAKINPLSYAKADAEKFYNAVSSSLSSDQTCLQLMTNQQATKQKILKAIGETLPRILNKEDLVLLYFSGHGSPETSGSIDNISRYLVTYDTEYENMFATAIDLEREFVRLIERLPSNLIVVLLDTCFSGRTGGRTFEGPNFAGLKAKWRAGIKLSTLNLGEGRVILAACDDDEAAYEYSSLKQGVFTYYLLKVLTDPNAVEDWISLNTLYEQVSQKVHTYTMGRQTPIMNGRLSMARLPILRD